MEFHLAILSSRCRDRSPLFRRALFSGKLSLSQKYSRKLSIRRLGFPDAELVEVGDGAHVGVAKGFWAIGAVFAVTTHGQEAIDPAANT